MTGSTPTTGETRGAKKSLSTLWLWSLMLAGMAATFPATWWVLGRFDHSSDWIVDPDYAVPPPQIPRSLAHAIGIVSVLLAIMGFGTLVNLVRTNRWPSHLVGINWPGFAAAAYVGMAAHVITAPGIGANIGAGLVVLATGPVAVILLMISLASWANRNRGR